MAASKTGSGKTLSYVLPVIEVLYRNRWSHLDGVGGLIIVPTRELV
jgi:ATP-dependent RNA helicase DDX10/DBP4